MKKFKILVLGHQLKNNVVSVYGDVVDESQLLGNANELVKAGFVEEIVEPKQEVEANEIEVEKAEIVEPKQGKKK
jgi:hypothetical protein